jgi:hypothetical protein
MRARSTRPSERTIAFVSVHSVLVVSLARNLSLLKFSSPYQPISSGTRQHLVDPQDVVRVHTDAHVERVLARDLGDVLVCANTTGFQGLGRDLLVLIREKVDTEGELVDTGLFTTW